jgi:hypothetical protein
MRRDVRFYFVPPRQIKAPGAAFVLGGVDNSGTDSSGGYLGNLPKSRLTGNALKAAVQHSFPDRQKREFVHPALQNRNLQQRRRGSLLWSVAGQGDGRDSNRMGLGLISADSDRRMNALPSD